MGDKTLREDFSDLRVTLKGFISKQDTWSDMHDAHSRKVLTGIEKNTDKLFSMHETVIEKVNDLSVAHAETRAQVVSVEKRVKWLWAILGGSVAAVIVGFLLKAVLTYLAMALKLGG